MRLLINLLLLAFAFLPLNLLCSDWPQWRGPLRTGYVPAGEAVPAALPAEPKVLWRGNAGTGFASPVVAGGKVFFLDNQESMETAHALDAATGKELWQTPIFAAHKDNFGIGPRCAPLADGDRLFVQSCKGEFQCLNIADGKLLWHKNFVTDFGAVFIGELGKAAGGSRHGNTGSPVIDGENVIVQVGSPNGASLVAFKKSSGELVWKSQNDQTAYAAPMIATLAGVKQVISFTIEGLIGLDVADGKLLWRVPMKTALGRHVTTPVIVDDLVLVASHQIGLIATRISKDASGLKAEQAWISKEMAINFACPVAVGHYLYGLGPAKNIFCLDALTGKLAWEKDGCILSAPDKAHASFMVMDKNILMLNDSGQLILFGADPQEFKEKSRVQVCGFNWCSPAYVDGKLFVRDNKEILCLNLL